ncbi:transducin family protein / WD-40 repeat family protein [Striga hermonthica]|uniref:Transducin family protein / WD-40 repeat family protein n=1 Tax=Striga hermonthica TaxID=68872 RepID=A0A9N7RGK9_STRHE|nr:transducin family protein / WD-40 repeat family protein [Striga hermonthica]
MPTQQQPAAADLDSLLQYHSGIDSDEDQFSGSPDRHRRTVDEILLSHSSSDAEDDDDIILTSIPSSNSQRLSPRSSSSSDKHNSADGSYNNSGRRNKYAGLVSPQLFGGGVIRSNAKPGAALAAAAAAARSVPTPHAAAIKLRRASTGVLQSSASETKEKTIAKDDSSSLPSAVVSTTSENGSIVGLRDSNLEFEKSDAVEQYVVQGNTAENSDEGAEVLTSYETVMEAADGDQSPRVDKDEECKVEAFESEGRKNLIPDDFCSDKHVLTKQSEEYPDVLPVDESGEKNESVGPAPTLDDVDLDEDASGGEEVSNSGYIATEAGIGDADGTSLNDVGETVENLVSLKQKSGSSFKALDLAEEIEKKQAFTGLHYEEGAAAQPMRLEGVHRGSTVIGYFDVNANNTITRTISSQAFRRDHGSPQVVAVHLNYIAVGLSKGWIIVMPSKYTAHHVDNMDAKMTYLGLQGDRSHVPVTSMCFNLQGDLLLAGYGDGHYTVWDVQKASALKVIAEHRAPVVHILYLGQDIQVTRQFNVVSGDSNGVVKLIRFSVVPWVNMISYSKPTKLLDETTGRVVCASPLLYGEGHGGSASSSQSSSAVSASSVSSIVDEGVVIFITHQSALVAKVSPDVEVYATIPKPDGVRDGAMPYAAWSRMSLALGSSSENTPVQTLDKVSLLAIAWDRNIQVAKLLNSKLKILEKWTVESEAVGLAWLGDQMLAILTITGHLYLFSKDGNLIHQTSYSVDEYQGDGLISYHIYFANALGNPEKAYHNSVAVRGATIYILGSEHLTVSRLLSWKDRIEVLRKAGDWMGAFNMAMALYDGQTFGVIDLPKNLDEIQRSLMPYLVELLQSYVSEVFSYISVSCNSQSVKGGQSDEIKEQYTRVGGVAVEFCAHIGRTDMLFDDILSKFEDAHQKETFLELLEPYILKDMLGSLPPAIMQALVEHYSDKGWLQRIEQCALHMDILSLDFNQIVRLCREHRLHCALIYLFNKGLDDFRTPLEELLVVLRYSTKEDATSLGYRMLVYLKYCFQGLAFPPGRGNLSAARLPTLRKELLHFLLEDSSVKNSWACSSLPSNVAHTNVLHLLELDTEATLEVLKCGLTVVEHPEMTDISQESTNFDMESAESQELVQKVVDILSDIVDAIQVDSPKCSNDVNFVERWPSRKDAYHMYDFIAHYVTLGKANVSRDILTQILEYLTSDVRNSDIPSETMNRREKQLLFLLEAVPESHWDVPYVLNLCEKAEFHQVCGYIHAIRHHYAAALDSYMKAIHEPVYAFSFTHEMLSLLGNEEFDAFESDVISRIPGLLKLSREATYFLITDHFPGKSQYILSELRSHPESLFLYLKTVIEVHSTGTLKISHLEEVNVLDFPGGRRAHQQSNRVQAYLEAISCSLKLLHNNRVNVTDELMEQYFELLCRYEQESVLKFLETSESYRVEHCLRLCQKYGITDAASFLLERVGDVGSALLLILSNLGEKFVVLGSEIQEANSLNDILNKKVVADILDIVHACVGLCQRNSPRLNPEESEFLWFQLLDFFCEPLMDSRDTRADSERGAVKDIVDGSLGVEDEERYKLKWKVSMYQGRVARMMRKLFSIFIKEIIEGMIGYVRLPQIMSKLLSDNSNQEFGDFRLTILGMLGAYDFERKILDSAKSLIEDDTYYTMSLLRKGASHGYAPRDLFCCICSSPLAKYNSPDSGIQVFSCGHTMHVQCEVQENRASFNGTIVGCPICNPKKSQMSNGKSTLVENGLVSRPPLRMQQAHGTSALHHHHDHEGLDSSYCLHPPSRFELLHNLENDKKLIQIERMHPLRLAPPALYHEKVKKGIDILSGESTSRVSTSEKPWGRQLKNVKVKGTSVRFPLKSTIFGREKISRS